MNKTDRMRLHINIDDQISELYNYTLDKLEDSQIQTPQDLEHSHSPIDQLNNIKLIIDKLTAKADCQHCGVYEKQLQRLEADIRQHIKLQHQLKLYQESLEDKVHQSKVGAEQEKNRAQQLKGISSKHIHQIKKLSEENEELKNQIKNLRIKRTTIAKKDQTERGAQSVQKRDITKRLEARTLLIQRAPLTKTINFNSNEERRSVDRNKGITITQDLSKHRQSLTNKSSHLLRQGVDRKKYQILMRDKENQKRKINKVQYRR